MPWYGRFHAINTSETGKWIGPQYGEWTISRFCYPRKLRFVAGLWPYSDSASTEQLSAHEDEFRNMEGGLLSSIVCISLHQPWNTLIGALWVNYLHCMPFWRVCPASTQCPLLQRMTWGDACSKPSSKFVHCTKASLLFCVIISLRYTGTLPVLGVQGGSSKVLSKQRALI